jgi:hypothetical protein
VSLPVRARSARALESIGLAGLVGALLAGAPRVAHACAVCFTGREDDARVAFIGTTVLLTLLPLAMIGGVAWWLWRRARALEREADAEPSGLPLPAVSRASSSR